MDCLKKEAAGLRMGTGANRVPTGCFEVSQSSFDKNITILEPWSDAIGLLHSVELLDGCCLAAIGPLVVSLPKEMATQLSEMVGQQIGVLRCDDGGYRLRRR